jgi:hypothetical protein
MCKIGEEVSERLDYTPAVLKVLETRREKYACKQHEESGVLTPPVPIHPIEKGMATSGLIAHVLVAKYKCGFRKVWLGAFRKVWRVAQGSEVIQQVEPGEDLLARGARMPTRVIGPGGG